MHLLQFNVHLKTFYVYINLQDCIMVTFHSVYTSKYGLQTASALALVVHMS